MSDENGPPEGDVSAGPEPEAEPIEIIPEMLAPEHFDSRVDFERGMSYVPSATILIIVTLAAVFVWQLETGALTNAQTIIDAGALDRNRVEAGEVWRLLSSCFLHGSFDHLIGNCLVLFIIGIACEHAYGALGLIAILLVSGVAGSVFSMLFEPGPVVGASGAIFGAVGCVTAMLAKNRHRIAVRDSRVGVVLGIWAAYQVFLGAFQPLIANFAHLGGLLAGVAVGLAWPPPLLRPKSSPPAETFQLD